MEPNGAPVEGCQVAQVDAMALWRSKHGIPCGVFCCGKPAQMAEERPWLLFGKGFQHFSLVMCAKVVAPFVVSKSVL